MQPTTQYNTQVIQQKNSSNVGWDARQTNIFHQSRLHTNCIIIWMTDCEEFIVSLYTLWDIIERCLQETDCTRSTNNLIQNNQTYTQKKQKKTNTLR